MMEDRQVPMQHILPGFGKASYAKSRSCWRRKLETFSCDMVSGVLNLGNGVIHQAFHNAWCHPFNNMFKDKSRHDCNGNHSPSCWQYVCNLRVLQANDVLPVDLTDVMIGEEAISGSRTIFHYGCDFSTFKDKANMPAAVLMHSDGPLKGPVTNGHGDLLSKCLLEHLVSLIRAPSRTVVTIDLQYLVPKSQSNQRGWGISLD